MGSFNLMAENQIDKEAMNYVIDHVAQHLSKRHMLLRHHGEGILCEGKEGRNAYDFLIRYMNLYLIWCWDGENYTSRRKLYNTYIWEQMLHQALAKAVTA